MRTALIALMLTACAAPYTLHEGEPVSTPRGYYDRCVPVALVENVTDRVYQSFVYTADTTDEWTNLSVDARTGEAYGDCEDYALTVQSRLQTIGYKPHTARMALLDNGNHAALVVESCEAGQVVVDNQRDGYVVGIDSYDPSRWHAIEGKHGFHEALTR